MLTPAIESIKGCLGESTINALQAQCFIEHGAIICFEVRRPGHIRQRLFVTLQPVGNGYAVQLDRVTKRRRLICEVTGSAERPEVLARILQHAVEARGKSEQWLTQVGLCRPSRKGRKPQQLVLDLFRASTKLVHHNLPTLFSAEPFQIAA